MQLANIQGGTSKYSVLTVCGEEVHVTNHTVWRHGQYWLRTGDCKGQLERSVWKTLIWVY